MTRLTVSSKRRWFYGSLLLFAAFGLWLLLREHTETPLAVALYTLDRGEVNITVANTRVGTIKPCRRAYLAPMTGGHVARLLVKAGDRVAQNQLLLTIWHDDLSAQVQRQTAQLVVDRAQAEQICLQADGASREAERRLRLARKNAFISEDQLDQAQTQAAAQRAQCQAARGALDVSRAQLRVAEAAVARASLYAPFAGVVAEVNVELGEFVTPSPPGIPTPPAIYLIDDSYLYVSAPIDEVDAARVALGMTACVTLDAFPGERCSGVVRRIAPYVLEKEKQARTVEVEVVLTDPAHLQGLLPGYSADLEILIAQNPHALRLPTEALLGSDRVLWVAADGRVEERRFQPGLSNWHYTEVLSGLQIGAPFSKRSYSFMVW